MVADVSTSDPQSHLKGRNTYAIALFSAVVGRRLLHGSSSLQILIVNRFLGKVWNIEVLIITILIIDVQLDMAIYRFRWTMYFIIIILDNC